MDFPWEAAIVSAASAGLSIIFLAGAIWRLYLRDIRQGLTDLRKDVLDLHRAERQEHQDVWGTHRSLYEMRITATYEALARERDDTRSVILASRHRQAQDEYLDLLDRAVKFPDVIDPTLLDNPEYIDFLKGRLSDKVAPGPITDAPSRTEEEKEEVGELAERVERFGSGTRTPNDLLSLGNAHYFATRYEEALLAFDEALALRTDDPGTLMNRGATLRHLGRYEEALQAYDQSLALRPNHPDTVMNRGIALHKLGRYEEALQAYTQSFAIRPGNLSTFYNRACMYSLWEKPDEALQDLRRAIEGDLYFRQEASVFYHR